MQAQILTSKFGGELISFKLNGEEKIHQGKDCIDENGKIYWKRHSPILFPVVGKLKKNQTIIGGRTYEMPQHGFARDLEFEPLTKLDNFHSYMLKSNKYTLSRYPYDFELYTTYRIDENKLTTIYKVINLNENSFKNDAIIMKGITSKKVSLKNKEQNKTILTMDFTDFPYLAIWSKPNAPFICIEPWYSTADNVKSSGVFTQKQDLIVLKPKQTFECKYTVEFF